MIDKADLLRVPPFANLPDDQIEWFLSHSQEMHLKAGEIYMRAGEPAEYMIVVLDGSLQARGEINGEVFAFAISPGSVTGVLPFSRMKLSTVTGRAITEGHILRFPASLFPNWCRKCPNWPNVL